MAQTTTTRAPASAAMFLGCGVAVALALATRRLSHPPPSAARAAPPPRGDAAARPRKKTLAWGFSEFSDHWSPKIAGTINDMHLKLVKLKGDFVWHHHDDEDELFLVTKGTLRMKIRDPEERVEVVGPGEFIIMPRGVEHCPCADDGEVEVLLLEPRTTLNTGSAAAGDKTVAELDTLDFAYLRPAPPPQDAAGATGGGGGGGGVAAGGS